MLKNKTGHDVLCDSNALSNDMHASRAEQADQQA